MRVFPAVVCNVYVSLLCVVVFLCRMGKDHRVTLSRRHAYRTLSNRVKTIKTPGGRFTSQLIKKSRKGVMCGDCGIALPGVSAVHSAKPLTLRLVLSISCLIMRHSQIKHMDSAGFKNCKKREKTVSRAYGGSRCGTCVRQR